MSDILHRVGIDAKPDKVFDALTTIEGLRGWWSSTASGSAAQGTKWATFLLSLRDLLEKSNGHPIPHDLKIAVNG